MKTNLYICRKSVRKRSSCKLISSREKKRDKMQYEIMCHAFSNKGVSECYGVTYNFSLSSLDTVCWCCFLFDFGTRYDAYYIIYIVLHTRRTRKFENLFEWNSVLVFQNSMRLILPFHRVRFRNRHVYIHEIEPERPIYFFAKSFA